MSEKQTAFQEKISFYFSRSKGTHEEAGEWYITLFGRLSVKIPAADVREGGGYQTIWVDIEEVKGKQATVKMKRMPDFVQEYEIPEELFWELYKISQRCPEELYYLTPLTRLHNYSSHG